MSIKKQLALALLFAGIGGISLGSNAAPSGEVTLQGVITNTTCDITINGGKSNLNVGVYKTSSFSPNTQNGSVPLNVTLRNCGEEETTGNLVIQGITSTANNDKNLFVNSAEEKVGFMIKNSSGDQLSADAGQTVALTKGTPADYTYQVGMGSTAAAPVAGAYSAPIVVAFIAN